jgi:hypothetical protein
MYMNNIIYKALKFPISPDSKLAPSFLEIRGHTIA